MPVGTTAGVLGWRAYTLGAVLSLLLQCASANAANPVGFIYEVSDVGVLGCAYDPDSVNSPIEVHAYHGEPWGMIGVANRDCPWTWAPGYNNDSNFVGRGFWIQLRKIVNSPSTVQVAMINAPGTAGSSQWFNMAASYSSLNFFDRATQTVLVQTSNYTIGLSKKYGGAIVEYYNNRSVDPNLNVINSNIGGAFQAALFGDPALPIPHTPNSSDCGNGQPWQALWHWNPTQAGNHCPAPNGGWQPNYVISCTSTLTNGCNGGVVSLGAGQSGTTQFFVRFRNWTYETLGSSAWYPYQTFDEVFGTVTYTFTGDYVRADYQLWRDGAGAGGSNPPPSRGVGTQQLPVVFATQMSEMVYKRDGTIISLLHNTVGTGDNHNVDSNDGRWVTFRANPSATNMIDPLMGPGNAFTVAFYTQEHAGACRPRNFQFNFVTELGTPRISNEAIVQNRVTFEPIFPNYIQFSAMVFPYDYPDFLPGAASPLHTLIDTYAPSGFKPAWECNM